MGRAETQAALHMSAAVARHPGLLYPHPLWRAFYATLPSGACRQSCVVIFPFLEDFCDLFTLCLEPEPEPEPEERRDTTRPPRCLSIVQRLTIMHSVSEALAFLETGLGLSHLDLKPENVMVKVTDGAVAAVKLIDFNLTRASTVLVHKACGSPGYMAPPHRLALDIPIPAQHMDRFSFGMTMLAVLGCVQPLAGVQGKQESLAVWFGSEAGTGAAGAIVERTMPLMAALCSISFRKPIHPATVDARAVNRCGRRRWARIRDSIVAHFLCKAGFARFGTLSEMFAVFWSSIGCNVARPADGRELS